MTRQLPALLLALSLLAPAFASAQQPNTGGQQPAPTPPPETPASAPKPDKWDVEGDHGPVKTVEFDTDEGTWMSCDVSPDGQWIVFDLLGDIHQMPITGGRAQLI